MKIGNITLKSNVFLAPMAGVTNLPFRKLCIKEGCALAFSEMVSAKALSFEDVKTKDLMATDEEDEPSAIQLFGRDPDLLADVIARYVNDTPFKIIDLNAGCPAPKIVNNGEGSALMKDPILIGRLVEAAVKVARKPVTLKIRAGWDQEHINAVDVAKIAQESGASAVTVHGRTRDQFYGGNANWDIIAEVVDALSIPVIGNGDITSQEKARERMEQTGCHGVMIGRAAMGNPWIFADPSRTSATGSMRLEACRTFFQELLLSKPEKAALGEIRKHASWFTKGLRGSGEFRNRINQTQTVDEVFSCLFQYEEELNEDKNEK